MNIQDTLRKMIEHEKSARKIGNQAEAEAFASKIQELLLKHKLEMSDLEVAEQERNEPVLGEWFSAQELLNLRIKKRHDNWVAMLLAVIADCNFCKIMRERVSNSFTIVGRESDREVVKQLFTYLSQACIEMAPQEAKKFLRSWAEDYNPPSSRAFITSYKIGFACAIYDRLKKKNEQLKAGAGEQGLIRIDQMTKVTEEKFDELFPPETTKNTAKPRIGHEEGFMSGNEYGSRVGINGTKRLTA